ncbi:hypothetical protein N7495_010007 [Penicillium taxi]|uniref:uncharacterized protein n=1 Tax=Penicillium taxi TaxID=168475 RepID=UPI0025450B7A|nr:uncharacterized protein N7495_010007 [Penicillium taxi]KAJ5885497.1 hypothetical protein N7495_010007 [Penicillium taxi]
MDQDTITLANGCQEVLFSYDMEIQLEDFNLAAFGPWFTERVIQRNVNSWDMDRSNIRQQFLMGMGPKNPKLSVATTKGGMSLGLAT